MHRIFLSYHHANDQSYKDELLQLNLQHKVFIDASVDTSDIQDDLPDERIRQIIRDDYLGDSTVTIVLVGSETKKRKHIDWEIYSSMYDGQIHKKSGIIVVMLPLVDAGHCNAVHTNEQQIVYPDFKPWQWSTTTDRTGFEQLFPFAPDRIIDNLLIPDPGISITNWVRIKQDPAKLTFLVDAAFADRGLCEYDLSKPMRRQNS